MEHERTARLGVRQRIVLAHGGRRVALSVFCPRHLQSTHLDVCRRCPRAVRIDDTSVTCLPEVDPVRAESSVGSAMGEASLAIEAGLPVAELARLVKSAGWMAVVVLDADHRALGLIDREAVTGADPSVAAESLVRPVEPVLESSPVISVVHRMVHERARALPVMDAGRSAVGLVTDLDALRWVAVRAKKT
ncbi:MAG TPA: CBS domain-containing protein [Polyangiaceae bacterium]